MPPANANAPIAPEPEENRQPIGGGEFARLIEALGPTSRLAVACSGGADSLALTLLAAEWARETGRELVALTVDHGLRAESAAEAEATQAWLASRGIAHHILRWAGPKPKANRAALAREARYRLLSAFCRGRRIPDLLLAHHLEDQAETFLLRLGRGSGVDGLAAMAAQTSRDGVRLLRPLLAVPRARLKATLRAAGQDWIEDPSNADPASARVRLRQLAPMLAAEGLTAGRLAATAARMGRARAALEAMTDRLIADAVSLDPAGFCRLDPAALRDAPEEIGLRALSRLLLTVSGLPHPARLKRLERLYHALTSARRGGATLQRCRFLPRRDGVLICREARELLPLALRANQSALWDCRFRVALTAPGGGEEVPAGLFVGALGEAGYRAIKDEIAAEHRALVPAPARPSLPALWDGQGVIAAPHFGFRRNGLEKLRFQAEFAPRWPLFAASAGSGQETAGFADGDIV